MLTCFLFQDLGHLLAVDGVTIFKQSMCQFINLSDYLKIGWLTDENNWS
jgi:hypothetical protein